MILLQHIDINKYINSINTNGSTSFFLSKKNTVFCYSETHFYNFTLNLLYEEENVNIEVEKHQIDFFIYYVFLSSVLFIDINFNNYIESFLSRKLSFLYIEYSFIDVIFDNIDSNYIILNNISLYNNILIDNIFFL